MKQQHLKSDLVLAQLRFACLRNMILVLVCTLAWSLTVLPGKLDFFSHRSEYRGKAERLVRFLIGDSSRVCSKLMNLIDMSLLLCKKVDWFLSRQYRYSNRRFRQLILYRLQIGTFPVLMNLLFWTWIG